MGGNHSTDGADEASWASGVEDDSGALMKTVGRQIKLWREAANIKQAELGSEIGYGEEMVSAVERGRRLPRPEFLDKADEVLHADGKLSAMKDAVAVARYPKKVRDLAKLEAEAVELGVYATHVMPGLLQTEEYARALFELRRPAYSEDDIDRGVAARMARQEIFACSPAPALTFVLEEVTLRRPVGGRAVARRQLEHLLELGQLRHVTIQVMPIDQEDHAGLSGPMQLLRLKDGTTLGYAEMHWFTPLINDPKEVQVFELRYGMIRAQALTPRKSIAFIQELREET